MTAATWSLAQITQAKSLRARLVVDYEVLQREPKVARDAEDEMATKLTDMAHPFAIELHRGDFEVQWEHDESTPWQVIGVMRWQPSTHGVELRAGHLDGQRYAVRNVGEPLRIPRPAVTPWLDPLPEMEVAAVVEMADTYELAGWREGERVWVYEAK